MQTFTALSAPEQDLIKAALDAVQREAQALGIQLSDEQSGAAAEGLARWFYRAHVPEPIAEGRFCNSPKVG